MVHIVYKSVETIEKKEKIEKKDNISIVCVHQTTAKQHPFEHDQ